MSILGDALIQGVKAGVKKTAKATPRTAEREATKAPALAAKTVARKRAPLAVKTPRATKPAGAGRDYFPRNAISATYEMTPGASTGHMSDVIGMPAAGKIEYGRRGAWASPETGGQDVLYQAAGLSQLPSIKSSGAYQNMAGDWEYNPLDIARPLGAPEGAVSAIERFRAVADAQEAGAANLPNTSPAAGEANALLLDTGAGGRRSGAQPTSEQLRSLIEGLGPAASTHSVTATNRGAFAFPYDPGESPAALAGLNQKYLEGLLPGSKASPATAAMPVYVPGVGKWGDEGIEPTTQYSGEATTGLLQELAGNPPELAMNLGESEGVRAALREKYLRDLERRNEMGASYRGDIQNTRKFFSETDWPRAVELIRAGMAPAAAIAALGYSSSALAGDTR
jgi:hypothetical protein